MREVIFLNINSTSRGGFLFAQQEALLHAVDFAILGWCMGNVSLFLEAMMALHG